MTLSIVIEQQAPRVNQVLSRESPLIKLRDADNRHEHIPCDWIQSSDVKAVFKSLGDFFLRLEQVHDDVLRTLKVKSLYQSDAICSYLASNYVELSDEEFVECDALAESVLRHQTHITRRLDFIQQHKNLLLFPNSRNECASWFKVCFAMKTFTLLDIRNLDCVRKIQWLFRMRGLQPAILSLDQKRAITQRILIRHLMVSDTRENIHSFLPFIPDHVLKKLISKTNELHHIPYQVIAKVDIQYIPRCKFYKIMHKNVKHLDKLDLPEYLLQFIFGRMISLALTTQSVDVAIEMEDGKTVSFRRDVPYFPPQLMYQMPGSIFKQIKFSSLSSEQLFVLFHPETLENRERFGSVMLVNEEGITEVTHRPHVEDTKRLTSDPKITFSVSEGEYLEFVEERERQNIEKLALLGIEVYKLIRFKLDPAIQMLGDTLYRIKRTKRTRRKS